MTAGRDFRGADYNPSVDFSNPGFSRAIERGLAGADPDRLRADLRAVSKQAV
jgi:hypothetical protein